MRIIGIIPARYASSRFPGKPLALINGKSMIRRVYEQAMRASELDDVVVATDDERIAAEIESFGGKFVMTRSDHVSGTDRCYEALCQQKTEFDAIINIQGDEPFIQPDQINLVARILHDGRSEISTLAYQITKNDELFSPNHVKVVFDTNGRALYFSRHPIPYVRNSEPELWLTQQAYYKHLGIYGYLSRSLEKITSLKPSLLEKAESLEQLRWLENGLQIKVGITQTESIGIDTPADLEKVLKLFR